MESEYLEQFSVRWLSLIIIKLLIFPRASAMEYLKVSQFLIWYLKQINTLNLNTKLKGILLHSGYSLVSDLLEHKLEKYTTLITGKPILIEHIFTL